MPTLFVVAGPNGCGKSTLTRTTWFGGVEVIDPDAIARDMASGSPGEAGREAVRLRRAAVGAGRPLVVETTLAGHGVLRLMAVARRAGYRIELHYVAVESPDRALSRIRTRVAQGGHHVPEADVRRRFARSLARLPAAVELSDEARLYDNTDREQPHREVAILKGGTWWTAARLPGWARAAVAAMAPPRP